MSETPSGNRWEPADPAQPGSVPAPDAAGEPPQGVAEGSHQPPSPVPAAPPSAGPATSPAARTSRRTRGLLAAGVAVVALAAGAGGYAVGTTTTGHGAPDTTAFTHEAPGHHDGERPDGGSGGSGGLEGDGSDDGAAR